MTREFDIVFIGSGPAGFTGAIRAAQLGKSVAIIELGFIGGVCLNRGCIPSKSMLRSSQAYADLEKLDKLAIKIENKSFDFLKMLELRWQTIDKIRTSLTKNIKANGIEIIEGLANLDENCRLTVNEEEILYKNLVVATGSSARMLPNLPEDKTLTSDTILALSELPEKTLIIGSGAIGIEWARILTALGKKVCILELADKLAPTMDIDVSKTLERIFKKQKIEFYTSTSLEKIEGNIATLSNGKEVEFDKILVAVGRVPNAFGMQNAPIELEKGFIKVDENLRTNIKNIYAAGDITGKQLLAHTAAIQAKKIVERIFLNKEININYKNIPAVIYGKPEIATVGFTEQELQDRNIEYKLSKLPLTISAKAFIDGEFDGMVKVLSVGNKIVGGAIVADDASSLLQQLTIAINSNMTVSEFNEVVFAHPTTSEAINEAVLNLEGLATHIPPMRKTDDRTN